jgi:hypothetical protein
MGRVPLGRTCVAAIVGVFLAGVCHIGVPAAASEPVPTDAHPTVLATIAEEATAVVGHADRVRMPSIAPSRAFTQPFDALAPDAIVLLALLAVGAAAAAGSATPGRRAIRVIPSRGPPSLAAVRS